MSRLLEYAEETTCVSALGGGDHLCLAEETTCVSALGSRLSALGSRLSGVCGEHI